ncbi:MAG TPA: ankyrin repeat domain-containing protein, partial [Burkholderiaceae bacterium]
MAEPRRGMALAWIALGTLLAWLPAAWPSPWAGAGVLFAPPLLMLGGAEWRAAGAPPRAGERWGVVALWCLAFALLATVVAWPLTAVRDSGSLAAVLGLSASAGMVLLAVWRLWPAFAQAARRPHALPALLALVGRDGMPAPTRGLAVAVPIFAVLGVGLVLAWPELVSSAMRVVAALAYPAFTLGLLALARRRAPAPRLEHLPIIEAPTPVAAAEPAEASDAAPDERLYAAARAGRMDGAQRALADGADPHALPAPGDRDQRTLPMLAALHSDLRLLRDLIARGVDLNRAHGGLTPLLAATRDSWHGRPEAVMTLLANGADPRAADGDGNTPLHHAARSTDPAVAALLLDAGALVDALNAEGYSALGVACAAGNWRLARFLIEHGAKPEPAGGQPALLAAAGGEDDPAGVQLLLRHKARVDA